MEKAQPAASRAPLNAGQEVAHSGCGSDSRDVRRSRPSEPEAHGRDSTRTVAGATGDGAPSQKSDSRNVNAFVKAVLRHRKLLAKANSAAVDVAVRRGRLKGGQLAEAARILGGRV